MVFDLSEIKDLEFTEQEQKDSHGGTCYQTPAEKIFLVVHKNTIEVRTDEKLRDVLCEKYESVMLSRHFGRGGIEIVQGAQLTDTEIVDLVRLSYRLSLT